MESKIKLSLVFITILGYLAAIGSAQNTRSGSSLLCYYNSTAFIREGLGKLIINDLEPALHYCTHLVYGYAGIDPVDFKLKSIQENLDLDQGKGQFRVITSLKRKYPNLKVILGVGGDADLTPDAETNKYLSLLESSTGRIAFINKAHSLIKTYGFDGLDLAWQFPKNKPKKIHSAVGGAWKSFKKFFSGDHVLDEKAEEHKEQFTALVRELKNAFRPEGFVLGMTVLPNVNSTYFYDVPAIINYIDFVNLFAFDFQTPGRNEKQADFPAPIQPLNDRNPESNINAQVQHWLNGHTPASKINVGVPAYGRAWIMSSDSGMTGVPPVPETKGEAEPGLQSLTPGLLSWPEICSKLRNPSNSHLKGGDAPLTKVGDPTKRYGPYAYRRADDNGEHGLWVGYEDPDSVAKKAEYVRSKGLGGLAFYDVSMDDFRGTCNGEKFPLLKAAKEHL